MYATIFTSGCTQTKDSQLVFDLVGRSKLMNSAQGFAEDDVATAHIMSRTQQNFTLVLIKQKDTSMVMVAHANRNLAVSWITKSGHQTGNTITGKTGRNVPHPVESAAVAALFCR
jgi:hypothetical protein